MGRGEKDRGKKVEGRTVKVEELRRWKRSRGRLEVKGRRREERRELKGKD